MWKSSFRTYSNVRDCENTVKKTVFQELDQFPSSGEGLGYRSGGPGSIPGTTRKKVVVLERGPLSLVSTTEELLDGKVVAPV
jgi:hypothetical protein